MSGTNLGRRLLEPNPSRLEERDTRTGLGTQPAASKGTSQRWGGCYRVPSTHNPKNPKSAADERHPSLALLEDGAGKNSK